MARHPVGDAAQGPARHTAAPVRGDDDEIDLFAVGCVYLTVFVLLSLLHGKVVQFRTGWFLESILTELLILLVVRTRKPFFCSRPSLALLGVSLTVAAVTLTLPYLFVNSVLKLAPLPPLLLLVLGGISVLYVATSEVVKRYFYAKMVG